MNDAPASAMAERKLTITRIFDAPRELVWQCWTDPDQFARWWGPEHFTTPRESVEIDLRPGGRFRSTMVAPDGSEYPSDGEIREVVAPERLVFAEDETDHPMIESQLSILTLSDLGDGRTELRIDVTMTCVEELIPMAEQGWASTLDKLAALLAER
jgi:uncharacterized protein YndB with AHSA1/START domain